MSSSLVRRSPLALVATLVLSACGGGGDDGNSTAAAAAAAPAATLICDTTKYVAGAVELPTATQLTAYAGTYNGDEGTYGPNPGDPFVKSGTASLVLGATGQLSYKGTVYPVTSVCVDKVAGPFGKILYLIAGKGHMDVADKVDATLGQAWGVSLADGTTIFTKGLKP
jgi:hypothetical protein